MSTLNPVLPALLALLVATAGCSALPSSPPPSDDRAVEVRDRMANSLEDVDSYRFEMDAYAYASQGDESMSFSFEGNGSVNRTRQVMHATTFTEDERRESYVFDGKASKQCAEPWSGWDVTNVSTSDDWLVVTPLGREQAVLEQSNVYWVGNETVSGVQTAVIEAYPSVDTLRSLPSSETRGNLANRRGIENISLRVWVSEETGRPIQSRLQVVAERGGATATVTLRTDYEDYDEPVSVTVPPEAKTDDYELGCPGAA